MTRSLAHGAHTVIAWLFVACCVVQVFLAGLGVFDDPDAFITHREFGYAFGWLTLLLLILAVVGRMGRRHVGLAVVMVGLLGLQSVLVAVRVSYPAVAALHPINGFALMFVAISAARLPLASRPGHADEPRVATKAV